MTSLRDHHSGQTAKVLLMGDSSVGKTGSLASLAGAGYKLRILDLDNGIDVLKNLLLDPKCPWPKAVDNVVFKTLTEKMRSASGVLVPATAKVWPGVVDALMAWKEGNEAFGAINAPDSTWDENVVLVLDSLTRLSDAALNYHLSLQSKLGQPRTQNEHRRDIGMAQQYVESFLKTLYDKAVRCNVVVISHLTYVDDQNPGVIMPDEKAPQVGFPSAIGKSLSPRIPQYFNSVLQVRMEGEGNSVRRIIQTVPYGIVPSKSPSRSVKATYPITTGLADYFKAIKEGPGMGASA